MKTRFVYVLLFVVYFVTLCNLYYRPSVEKLLRASRASDLLRREEEGEGEEDAEWDVETDEPEGMAHLVGKVCLDPSRCHCPRGTALHSVGDDELVVLNGRQLDGGKTYCIPAGRDRCNPRVTVSTYTLGGWVCTPRRLGPWSKGGHVSDACHHPEAKSPALNFLVEAASGRQVGEPVEDLFAVDAFGDPLYKCHCLSEDKMGNEMVSPLPQTCTPDYCLRNVLRSGSKGWDGSACDCGRLYNETPGDPTSACSVHPRHFDGKVYEGFVRCTTRLGRADETLPCPETFELAEKNSLAFRWIVDVGGAAGDFVRSRHSEFPNK